MAGLGSLFVRLGFRFSQVGRFLATNTPSSSWRRLRLRWRDRRWDARLGIATAGETPLEGLTIDSPAASHGHAYAAVPYDLFFELLERLDVLRLEFGRYTFVDFGCGRGRALLLAALRPFREVVGVEFAAELVSAARANLARYAGPPLECGRVRCLHQDAATFPIPDGPLLVFLYNPFREPVFSQVLGNLRQAVEREPRELLLVYFDPRLDRAVLGQGFHSLLSTPDYRLYRWGPAGEPGSSGTFAPVA